MSTGTIELFFDFISPYAYLAWMRSGALAAATGRRIVPRPVIIAPMLTALGTRGPAEVPARRAYLIKDLIRAAHRAGVPFGPPPTHPFNPLLPARIACLELEPELRQRIITALYAATWGVDATGIDTPERVTAVLAAIGVDAAPLIAGAASPEAKQRLRANTDEALARGAFGVPTLFVDGEMFFGFSAYPEIEAFVRGEDPVHRHAEVIARWASLPATAQRA